MKILPRGNILTWLGLALACLSSDASVIPNVGDIEVEVSCDGTSKIHMYKTIFNVQLILDGKILILTERGNTEILSTKDQDISVEQASGTVSDVSAVLDATLHIDRDYNFTCNIYGLSKDEKRYPNVTFNPRLSYFGGLNFHLFTSSMVLVYMPFVIMPSLWCSCPQCTRTWRNPEEAGFKFLRGLISLLDGFLFTVWWGLVYSKYGHTRDMTAYLTFAYIEGCFIFLYALFRCLFKFFETQESIVGPERAQHGRVATSYGAVITPVICWLMIKIPNSLPVTPLEICFCVLAALSLLFFMFVSHLREGRDWDKKRE